MAETQVASSGWGGEVWLSSDSDAANLIELVQVVSYALPSDEAETIETTHLKSPGRRREYTQGMIEGGEVEVVLNFRPGSDTDLAIEEALASGDPRAVLFVVPELGIPTWQYSTLAIVSAYDKGDVAADGKLEATMTLKLTGETIGAAYVPPLPLTEEADG
jgi:hypothetical protein